ncbi:MAG: DUF2510 domain-containing protein [Candidatus Nanopelagicales bacterium]|nr:DUF2510 domain-containing protein [Candidatus Nanopelagicales bacterium]
MSDDTPSAGWYPNPDGTGGLRWWSGVGWTEYTRTGEPVEVPEPVAPEAPEAAHTQAFDTNPWGQPIQPVAPTTALGGYPTYTPAPIAPLTASRMRPLSGMFSDIGRITRRAWLPILAISLIIWTAMGAITAAVLLAFVDVGALRRGLDAVGVALDASPDGSFSDAQSDAIVSAFGDAFNGLSPAGWLLLGVGLGVLGLFASTMQVAAVSRLSMDATTAERVSWAAGWKSGFSAGARLFGYYILLMIVVTVVIVAITALIALAAQVAPALAVALGILALLGFVGVSFWLTGRLLPTVTQAVVGRHAIAWSWRATKGKALAVLGRYLLWAFAASIIVNVVVSVLGIPVGLLVLGESVSSSSSVSSLGSALVLNLIMTPFSMALGAITIIGLVPIWRDLSDHPQYRSIDEAGNPIPAPTSG